MTQRFEDRDTATSLLLSLNLYTPRHIMEYTLRACRNMPPRRPPSCHEKGHFELGRPLTFHDLVSQHFRYVERNSVFGPPVYKLTAMIEQIRLLLDSISSQVITEAESNISHLATCRSDYHIQLFQLRLSVEQPQAYTPRPKGSMGSSKISHSTPNYR